RRRTMLVHEDAQSVVEDDGFVRQRDMHREVILSCSHRPPSRAVTGKRMLSRSTYCQRVPRVLSIGASGVGARHGRMPERRARTSRRIMWYESLTTSALRRSFARMSAAALPTDSADVTPRRSTRIT